MWAQAPFWYVLGPVVLMLAAGVAMRVPFGLARMLVGTAAAAALVMDFFVPAQPWAVGGLLLGGGLVRALAVILLGAVGGIVAFADGPTKRDDSVRHWPALVALSAAAALVALAADDVYLLVGAVEMTFIPILWLATRGGGPVVQTGFVASGLSAALFLWGGASLASSAAGSSLSSWPEALAWSPGVGVAMVAVLFALAWKLMILPFGLGFFEMFERSPWPTAAMLQTVFLPVAVTAAGRVVVAVRPSRVGAEFLLVFGTLGILFGAVGLARRRSVRTLSLALGPLAAAWMFVTWVAQGWLLGDGSPSFVLMVGSWTVALLALSVAGFGMEGPGESPVAGGRMPSGWYGLGARNPFLAIGLLAALANALGSPFTAGFVARLAVLRGLVDVSVLCTLLIVSAWVVGLQPVVSLGSIFFRSDLPPAVESSQERLSMGALVVVWTGAAVGIAAGILPGGAWRLILAAVGG